MPPQQVIQYAISNQIRYQWNMHINFTMKLLKCFLEDPKSVLLQWTFPAYVFCWTVAAKHCGQTLLDVVWQASITRASPCPLAGMEGFHLGILSLHWTKHANELVGKDWISKGLMNHWHSWAAPQICQGTVSCHQLKFNKPHCKL
jgi:hypothetical protein